MKKQPYKSKTVWAQVALILTASNSDQLRELLCENGPSAAIAWAVVTIGLRVFRSDISTKKKTELELLRLR